MRSHRNGARRCLTTPAMRPTPGAVSACSRAAASARAGKARSGRSISIWPTATRHARRASIFRSDMVSDIARKPKYLPRLRMWLAILAVLIVLLSPPGYWLLGTESGMRAAFSALETLSAGAIQADGIRGHLADSVQL